MRKRDGLSVISALEIDDERFSGTGGLSVCVEWKYTPRNHVGKLVPRATLCHEVEIIANNHQKHEILRIMRFEGSGEHMRGKLALI